MFSNKLNYKIINFTALMLLFYIGFSNIGLWFQAIGFFISLLFPFLIAFSFAYSLYPLMEILMRKGMKKYVAVTLITVGFSLLLLCLIVVTFPLLYNQLVLFSKYIVSILENVGNKFNWSLGEVELKLTDYLNSILKHFSNVIGNGTFHLLNQSIEFLSKLIVGYIAGIYFLYNMSIIRDKIKIITKKISKKCYQYMKCLDIEIGNYVKGLVTIMLVQLIEYSLLFLMVGHPNWLLLGILASITTIIPYFGGIFTNVIGVVIATTISTKVLIGTTIICILFPFIDSYFICPKVYGKTNDINPLVTIMIISIGGSLFGIIGIMASLPVYLLCRTTYTFFKKNIKNEVKKITTNI